jgi:hypothetical protein
MAEIQQHAPMNGVDSTHIAKEMARRWNCHTALLAFAKNIKHACALQANLLSTASDLERRKFIELVYAIYNDQGSVAIEKAQAAS